MKTMLFKHIFMKIRQNYKRFLSLLFMALLGIGFYAGIEACSPDMLKTLDKFYDDNNVYDILIFSNLGLDDNDIDRLSNIDGVDKVIGSYEKDTYLKLNNEQYVIKVIGLNDNINKVYIEDGRLPNNNDEIVVEKKMIVDNNLSIGDSIDILGSNKKIVGTIISPLYFSTERPSTNLGSGKVNYYAYTLSDLLKSDYYSAVYLTIKDTMHMLTNSKEYQNTINNFVEKINVIKKDREEERYDELYGKLISDSKLYGININEDDFVKPHWYIYDRFDNNSYKELINASDNIKNLGNVFPLIFFGIAILVSLISMMRMIEEDRTENGALKSLGYSNFYIILKYVIFSLLATIIGGVLGVFIGSYLIPYVIWNIYKKIFYIPIFLYSINSVYNMLGFWICILCISGTAIIICIFNLKDVPANLMRPKVPKSGKKILLEKITFIWKRLKFSDKITFRNIFRYKSRALTTIFGIAGCTALILAGFGLKDSIKNISDYQFNNIFKYDKMVVINENNDYSELVNNIRSEENVLNVVLVNYQSVSVLKGDDKQDVSLIVPEEFNKLNDVISLINYKDNNIIYNTLEDNTCAVSEKTARILNINIGDHIDVLDNDNNIYKIKVSYIVKNYINQYMYISKNTYKNLFGNYKVNSLLIDLNKYNVNESNDFDSKYISSKDVISIVNNIDIKDTLNDMLSSIDSIVAILIIAAAMLAFVVLYNLSNINISERKREIATLKVLGFYVNEVDKYINRETILLTLLGISFGLCFGSYLCHYIISTCEPDYLLFDRQVFLLSYVFSALITIIFSIIVLIVTHFNLKKINMVESLKNVE